MVDDDFAGDEIHGWSEVKLGIIREYAAAYSRILSGSSGASFKHFYIDGLSGAGVHRRKGTDEEVLGSPAIALQVDPPFSEYHFIDMRQRKIEALKRLTADRPNAFAYEGNCNQILREQIFPRVQWKDFCRALCLLDPYGMQVEWETIQRAASMKTIELFVHFPIGAMNRNVLLKNFDAIEPEKAAAMDRVWGDGSWKSVAYRDQLGLFGDTKEKTDYRHIAESFRKRLHDVAGFAHVPEPVLMRNSKRVPLYYFYFASHKPVAGQIVTDIFNKHRAKEGI